MQKKKGSVPTQNLSFVFLPYISIEREPWILLFSFHKSRRRRPSHTVFVLRALRYKENELGRALVVK